MPKRVKVIEETGTGRDSKFHDNFNNIDMSRNQFVDEIRKGTYPNHHIRIINGIETPVSNPDKKKNNNLG